MTTREFSTIKSVALFSLVAVSLAAGQATSEPRLFNTYILKAVQYLDQNYPAEGYGQSAYTHDLHYGDTVVKASHPPETMCVAAVAEVIITALDLYMQETGDKTPLNYLPAIGWERLGLRDIRSHIWVDARLKSNGTADALSTFGIGRHAPFKELTPGSFINLNRDNGSGHAVIFLGFIDDHGKDIAMYGPSVAGFKYFSSQGKHGASGSGLGYRYAFFDRDGQSFCPTLAADMKRDCTIKAPRYDKDYQTLNSGYMLMPQQWDKEYRDTSLDRLEKNLYQQNYSKGFSLFPTIHANNEADFINQLRNSDTMQCNAKYNNEDLIDE
jgi:hypothetical protein